MNRERGKLKPIELFGILFLSAFIVIVIAYIFAGNVNLSPKPISRNSNPSFVIAPSIDCDLSDPNCNPEGQVHFECRNNMCYMAAGPGVSTCFREGFPCGTTCAQQPSGMISWWPSEDSGTSQEVLDLVGGNNGDASATVTQIQGLVGQTLQYNGVDGYVAVPNAPNLNPQSVSLDAWIQKTGEFGDDETIIAGADSKYAIGFIKINNVWNLVCKVYTQSQSLMYEAYPVNFQTGWHHIACTYDMVSGALKLYFDGSMVDGTNGPTNNPLISNEEIFTIGGHPNNGEYFSGQIDEVQVYNRALSATEIQAIYNAGSAGVCRP